MKKKLLRLLLAISVAILLIATPLYLLVEPGYVHRFYARPDFPLSSRFTPAERQRLSDVLVNYLRGRATLEDMVTLRTDAGDVAMLPGEVQHMVDVKMVTDGFFIAHGVALALAGVISLLMLPKEPLAWSRAVRHGIWGTAALLVVVAVSAIANFDLFFDLFHRIFFQEGTWLFYYEDTLIQLYPLPLWIRAVADMVIAITVMAAGLYGSSLCVDRYVRSGGTS